MRFARPSYTYSEGLAYFVFAFMLGRLIAETPRDGAHASSF